MISIEVLKEFINSAVEKEWLEFKKNRYEKDELGQYISALSNSAAYCGKEKAYCIWGVTDKDRAIVGTKFNPDEDVNGNEPLKHYLNRQLSPDVLFDFGEFFIDGKRIVVLEIAAAKNIPTAFAGARYIRIGSSKEKLWKYPEKEIYLFKVLTSGYPTIENTESQYQDLTFRKLFGYYGSKGVLLKENTFRKNLGLLTKEGKYNILAQLLSDNSHLPLRVAIFDGDTKASKLFSVREFGYNCLLYSLDDLLRYGDVLNIIQADEEKRIVERKEVSLFDNSAFREAIINAVLHNKWVDGNEPMFTVFSDRIEILSRGTLAPHQTLEGFFAGESIPVNEKLSEIFLQLHISEKTGRGVPEITKKYGKNVFVFKENAIVVKIPFNWIHKVGSKAGRKKELTSNRESIIKEVGSNSQVTIAELAKKIGISTTAIDNNIKFLKEKGYIQRSGSDKKGRWEVLKSR